jgi:cytoskeletal protein RodZ
LKEIGEKLKSTREAAGLTVEEVSEDLKVDVSKIKLIEEGITETCKDIYEIKDYISIYAKYLNLNVEDIMKEFNEFVFDYTCKIPMSDLEKQTTEDKPKIVSPYTKEIKKQKKKTWILLVVLIILIGSVIGYVVFKDKLQNNTNISYLN